MCNKWAGVPSRRSWGGSAWLGYSGEKLGTPSQGRSPELSSDIPHPSVTRQKDPKVYVNHQ